MKNTLFLSTILCLFFSLTACAQTKPTDETAAVLKAWDNAWKSYEAGDEAGMWAFYAENASEVYPDGSEVSGKKALREGYDFFKTMLEGSPTFSYQQPSVRFIEPNVALLSTEAVSDIKLKGGQQIGGKTRLCAVVHKVNGVWLLESSYQTLIVAMPEPPATTGN